MIEKLWPAVAPVQLTAAGNTRGLVTITSTSGFKVKMAVTIADGSNTQLLEVKRVVNETQMFLGEKGDIKLRSDLSSFPAGSSVWALEQPRNSIPLQEIERAIYEEEPTVARRVIQVDELGRPIKTVSLPGGGSSISVSVSQLTQNVEFTEAGQIKVSDSLQGTTQGKEVIVGSSPVEAIGGAARLSSRKGLFIYALSQGNYIGFNSSVTVNNGIPIFQNQMVWIAASGSLGVWLIRGAATGQVRIWEVG